MQDQCVPRLLRMNCPMRSRSFTRKRIGTLFMGNLNDEKAQPGLHAHLAFLVSTRRQLQRSTKQCDDGVANVSEASVFQEEG